MESSVDSAGSDGPYIRRVLIFLALAALTALSWQFRDLLLLVFGAVVVAVILRTLSDPFSRHIGMPEWAAVLTAVVVIAGVVAAGVWFFGPMISAEVRNLGVTLPEAWRSFQSRFGDSVFWERVSSMFTGPGGGGLTGLGLWLIGVPSALVLGLLAGVLEFIPLAGPVLAAIPALLLALTVDVNTALLAAGLMLLVQQIEGNIIQPLVQRYAVQLPPALFLFALIGFAAMFGATGIILAAPLTVVVYVLIKRLYVQEALGESGEREVGSG